MKFFYKFLLVLFCFSAFLSCKSTDVIGIVNQQQPKKDTILPVQEKYARIMGVAPKKIENVKLYQFIDSWMDAPYRMGGETKNGIDCSFFTQFLYHDVYDSLIERTAEKQYLAPDTDKFIGQEFLKQGDLLFFNPNGSQHHKITHVGIYLGNNKFVHSTSNKDDDGKNGVQISDFRDNRWQRMFVSAGRKPHISEVGMTHHE